ncbi:MAG: hypothetical protein K2X04_07435 [Burkholderiales bacterium]|nr:hypothetical protein [Burkholderiales bacterium]
MNHYNHLKTTISSILISAGLVACVGENNTASVSPSPLASAKNQVLENKQEHGLIGHYFAARNFQEPLFQAQHLSANLSFNQDELEILKNLHKNGATDSRKQVQVQSVYWTGYIQFNKNISSILQLSPMNAVKKRLRAQIYINGQLLKPNTPFEFSANKYYKIKISINSANSILSMLHELNPVLISINTHAGTVEQVKFANLFTPNKLPRESQLLRSTAESTALEEHDVIRENALSGFVIEASGGSIIAKQWLPGYYADGKLKLYSSVNADTTLGSASPWKDQDKINALSSADDLGISYDALNPVVAAYPIIRPIIDTVQVALNQSIATGSSSGSATGTEQSITNTKVHEVTNSNSINVGANLGASAKEGANGGVNFSYSHNWGTSDTTTTGSEQGNSLSLSVESNTSTTIDTNNYANIQMAMRFKNVGTAAINNFQPSFNISVFKDNKLVPAMQSIFKNDNRTIGYINPWEVYPKLNAAPENYTTGDDFNGTKIQLTKENFELLSTYPIIISVPQLFTKNDSETKVDWNRTIGQINQQTALFILRTPRADIERRVFALDSNKAELQRNFYPELNLRDAFYVAFQLIPPTISKKFWQYSAKFNISNYPANYQFESLQVLSDENTYSNMMDQQKQLSKVESDIIDTYKIRAQMQFVLAPVGWVINNKTSTKSYATLQHGFYRNEATEIDGKWYLFDANGELVTEPGLHEVSGFQVDKKLYYVSDTSEHSLYKGWKIINDEHYYFDESDGYKAKRNSWVIQDNKCQKNDKYYIGNDYKLLHSGFTVIDGSLYFLSPREGYYIPQPKPYNPECGCFETLVLQGGVHVSKEPEHCLIHGNEYIGVAWRNISVGPFRSTNDFIINEKYLNRKFRADKSGILTD